MPPIQNTTTTAQFSQLHVREIDFIERFTRNWDALLEIMGIMRPIRKTPGTQLVSSIASVELAGGTVPEGDEVPLSLATVKPVAYGDIALRKYRKAVTAEAVSKYGAAVAVQKTDDALLSELQGEVMDDFYAFAQTGTLTGHYNTFQMAVSMAVSLVKDKFKKMHRDYSNIVAFVNTLDVGEYLGTATITVQTQNGIEYLQNFLGASTVIITSEIPEGHVLAIPADNIILYYIDPSDADFEQLGLVYNTGAGETRLIGIHKEGNYGRVMGETHALMGMKLWAEYLDGISNVTFGDTHSADLSSLTIGSLELTPAFDGDTTDYTAATSNASNKVTAVPVDDDATVEIKVGETAVENGSAATWSDGENTLTVKVTSGGVSKTYTVTVTKS